MTLEMETTRFRDERRLKRLSVAILLIVMTLNVSASRKLLGQKAGESALSESDRLETNTVEANVDDRYVQAQQRMVEVHLKGRDINNEKVLEAMGDVSRHEFVRPPLRHLSYRDSPLPIGAGQTISQPYIVALMTQLADPRPGDKALDIGTGSGYQAAILSKLVDKVYSIEIVESLAKEAKGRLEELGYKNVEVRHGDGYAGWQAHAPFDVIIVAAAPDHVPPALIDQLAPGGKLVIPVGDRIQSLFVIEKGEDGKVKRREVIPVRFVPMTGAAEE